jgi:hypothetical protein
MATTATRAFFLKGGNSKKKPVFVTRSSKGGIKTSLKRATS